MNKIASKLAIIVLCWNGKRWLDACLSSLLQHSANMACNILVVDNGSTDGSADFIRHNFPTITLIESDRNLGFAGGNNLGISHALKSHPDHILLLNQDTIVFDNWLPTLFDITQTYPEYGILSPFQYTYEGEFLDRIFESQLRANTSFFEDKEHQTIKMVYDMPQVIGAAMLLRTDLLTAIGNFDPFYFLYFEEKDLCRRTLAAGYKIGVVPKSKIGHYHGQIHADQLKITDVDGYFLRNRQVFILKDPNQSFLKNLYIFLRYGLPNSLRRTYDTPATPPTLGKAICTQMDVFFHLPQIFWRRRWECRRIQLHCQTVKS